MDQITARDRKYMPKTPSKGFSPARSEAIIEGIIQHNDRERSRRAKEWADVAAGKVDAAVSFLKRRANGSSLSIEDYFGPALKNEILGKRFAEKIKMAQMMYKKTKNDKFLL